MRAHTHTHGSTFKTFLRSLLPMSGLRCEMRYSIHCRTSARQRGVVPQRVQWEEPSTSPHTWWR